MEGHASGGDSTDFVWSVRVTSVGEETRVYAGRHTFSVGKQASFDRMDAHPSAVEYLLGALGSDLVSGYKFHAAKRGITIDTTESVVSGRLNNPMVVLGAIGAKGHPGFEAIDATLYVSSDEKQPELEEVWRTTLATSPLVGTLERSVNLSLRLQLRP